MSKSSRKQIDMDEKMVISELQKNAKESIDKIASKCKFSRQKVWRIIKRLEKNRSIWGYTARVNEEKQDLKQYTILIKKTTLPLDEKLAEKIVTRRLESIMPKSEIRIENSFYVHGVYDWIVSFTAKDIKVAKKFCEKFIELYKGYIAELNLLETLFSVKRQGILNPKAIELKQFL
jgi:DNA-binding Lrp family transcriptional regulator